MLDVAALQGCHHGATAPKSMVTAKPRQLNENGCHCHHPPRLSPTSTGVVTVMVTPSISVGTSAESDLDPPLKLQMRERKRKGIRGGGTSLRFQVRCAPWKLARWSAQPTPLRSTLRLSLRSVSVSPSPSSLRSSGPYCVAALLAPTTAPVGAALGCAHAFRASGLAPSLLRCAPSCRCQFPTGLRPVIEHRLRRVSSYRGSERLAQRPALRARGGRCEDGCRDLPSQGLAGGSCRSCSRASSRPGVMRVAANAQIASTHRIMVAR